MHLNDFVWFIVRDSGLYASCGALPEGALRQANLRLLSQKAAEYESVQHEGLSGFLRQIDLEMRQSDSRGARLLSENENLVRIMTMHKSKGLEFPVVFLMRLSQSIAGKNAQAVQAHPLLGVSLPYVNRSLSIRRDSPGAAAFAGQKRLDEMAERCRLLYVAMTRPKYRLVMTYCIGRLEAVLSKYAQSLTLPLAQATVESAQRMGDWVLMTALTRTEAGALFAVAGNPECGSVSEYPWRITYQSGGDFFSDAQAEQTQTQSAEAPWLAPALLQYAHKAATEAPSKLTATQLKGRTLDEEISEQTVRMPIPRFTEPQFSIGKRPLTAAERGTAIHLAMQYLRYENCTTLAGIARELERLVEEKFLTQQQGKAVPTEKLLAFFSSDIGKRVLSAKQVVREFKFSVLQDVSLLGQELAGEQVLLQGVTDCCIVERDGLTILDFKSDRVAAGEEAARGEYYRGQLDAYSMALSRIFELPVKERILYFFATDTAITI